MARNTNKQLVALGAAALAAVYAAGYRQTSGTAVDTVTVSQPAALTAPVASLPAQLNPAIAIVQPNATASPSPTTAAPIGDAPIHHAEAVFLTPAAILLGNLGYALWREARRRGQRRDGQATPALSSFRA